jgi:uncharacterized membrane protein YgcG
VLRAFLLAVAGLALAGLLALGVFFASEAALLGDEQSPLAPASVTLSGSTSTDDSTTARTSTAGTTTQRPTTATETRPTVTTRTETGDDRGRGRGRNRGRGGSGSSGNSGSGGSDDD